MQSRRCGVVRTSPQSGELSTPSIDAARRRSAIELQSRTDYDAYPLEDRFRRLA